jgi:hypothetical protein
MEGQPLRWPGARPAVTPGLGLPVTAWLLVRQTVADGSLPPVASAGVRVPGKHRDESAAIRAVRVSCPDRPGVAQAQVAATTGSDLSHALSPQPDASVTVFVEEALPAPVFLFV